MSTFLQIHKRIAKGYLNVLFKEKCSTKVSQDDITSNTKVSSSVCVCLSDKSVLKVFVQRDRISVANEHETVVHQILITLSW